MNELLRDLLHEFVDDDWACAAPHGDICYYCSGERDRMAYAFIHKSSCPFVRARVILGIPVQVETSEIEVAPVRSQIEDAT